MRVKATQVWFLVVPCAIVLSLLAPPAGAQDPYKTLNLISPKPARQAEDFTVPRLGGKTFRLGDYRGRVVFLNFWATWCPPCREEMPTMERLHQRYKGKGFVMLAVSIDAEGASVVAPFVNEHHLTYLIGLDPRMTLAEQYRVRALPSTFLVDKAGRIAGLALGPRNWNGQDAHALVELLLR